VSHARNRGLSAARNTAFAHARTDFLFLLDDDDLLEPTAVEKTLACLVSHPGLAFANGFHVGFGAQQYVHRRGFHHGAAFLHHNLVVPHVLVRRSAFEAAGGFDESIVDGLEDWDFWLRCADRGLWGMTVPEPLTWYRRRPDHPSRWRNLARHEALAAFRARMRERYPRLYAGGFPRLGDVEGKASGCEGILPANELASTGRRALVALPPSVDDVELVERVEQLAREGHEVSVAVLRGLDPSTRARLARRTPDVFVLRDFLAPDHHAAFLRHLVESRRPALVLGGENALVRAGGEARGAGRGSSSLAERLGARAELDDIESSRSWQVVEWIASRPALRVPVRILLGPPCEAGADADPAARVACIRTSRAYRLIQALKRNPLYRLYARRRWGPDWELARGAG
jgi:hypothetical protein